MRRSSILGMLVVAIVSGILGYFILGNDFEVAFKGPQETGEITVGDKKSVAQKGARSNSQDTDGQIRVPESDKLKYNNNSLNNNNIPKFDVVRVEKNGEALFAGRALPQSKVTIENNGLEIAQSVTDETGAFVALSKKALSGASNQVTIRSIGPEGKEIVSKQAVAIGVTKGQAPLVALAEPGKAITLLQRPNDDVITEGTVDEKTGLNEESKNQEVTEVTKSEAKDKNAEEEGREGVSKNIAENEIVQKEDVAELEKEASSSDSVTSNNDAEIVFDKQIAKEKAVANFLIDKQNSPLNKIDKDDELNTLKQVDNDLSESDNLAFQKKRVARLLDEKDKQVENATQGQEALDQPVISNTDSVAIDNQNAQIQTPSSEDILTEKVPALLDENKDEIVTKEESKEETASASVTVEAVEIDGNKLFIAGSGQQVKTVRIYIDDEAIGDIQVKDNGRWLFEDERRLTPGNYKIRVDQLNDEGAIVTARAEVPFIVEEKTQTEIDLAGGGSIIIRRNDNLWTIAQRVYGSGIRYTAIYEQNRNQIQNPDLIFPGQIFNLPKLEKEPTSRSSE